ncbi:SdrD B-like domain-containing protein, partial [Macrococcoides caseolyticum]|uniref:SdrD B-like domain-containing protein n=1 Tax=Macrococcoides caseolyticum TaxID=69966 RepID=UPI001F397B81
GDYVWIDSNGDGIQNSNETPVAGVTVTLTKPDGTTATAVTDAAGHYEFTGLENGDYTVTFSNLPEGYTP